MQLIIAEKPSVAITIAQVLKVSDRKDGYLEGNGFIISWCYGHLAGLADAEHYDPKYSKWKKEDLPIFPQSFQFRITAGKQKQFDIIKKLMRRKDVTAVINACDAGREGELIFRTVYYLAGCNKPMKRLWISSMEDTAIREGFDNLRPGSDFDGLHQSALCRAKADWLVGINATRFFSLIYGTTLNIGRVMSPTLSILVQRESEIASFVPEPFYTVELKFADFNASSEKYSEKELADALASACNGAEVIVKKIDQKTKEDPAPPLYDLTTLQRDANRILGYTAQQTLDYVQSLYEKKLCTYPRTDSRYLTNEMEPSVKPLVLCAAGILDVDLPTCVLSDHVCYSEGVTDHHAIIPTMVAGEADLNGLPKGELDILKLIARQVLISISPDYRYTEAAVELICADTLFKSNLKQILDLGWKQYTEQDIKQHWFNGLEKGQSLTPADVKVKDGKTQPPHRFTEDLLLSSMENAGGKEMPVYAERKGLGTPATRAGILEKLIATGMVERKKAKKQTHLIPTALGQALITVIPEELQSPLLTGEWEHCLNEIQHDELPPGAFIIGIKGMVQNMIASYEPVPGSEILFPTLKQSVGKCPRCGSHVYENNKGFFCESRECKFALWKNNRFFNAKKKELTTAIASDLLEKGSSLLRGCYSQKTGITYNATVILEDDGVHTNYRMVFDNG